MQAYYAGDIRRVDNSPMDMVIDQETFKVGKEGVAVFVAQDVEVTVVGIVLAGRVVLEERDPHIGIGCALGSSLHRAQQHGGHQTDMIR